LKAVETLNAMTMRNANKTAKEYPGEFRVICAPDMLHHLIMDAFQWYESGELVNPDTGNKWKEDVKPWERKHTVAYTFKCIRGMGKYSLTELVARITQGLEINGELTPTPENGEHVFPPKVYIGSNRPKNKYCYSLKDWTDRKKQKNAVIRWINKYYPAMLWVDDDVNLEAWKSFKREIGFNSAHMDELIRRGNKNFLAKFMKASDNPKREQESPPLGFLAEISRLLKKKPVFRPEVAPLYGVLEKTRKFTKFSKVIQVDNHDEWGEVSREDWQAEVSEASTIAGGIIDFRPIDEFLQEEDFEFDAMNGRSYKSILDELLKPADLLHPPPHWLVISHSNKCKEVQRALKAYLPNYTVQESQYMAATAEKYFFSNTTIKKGNGVVVLVFSKSGCQHLAWKEDLRSDEKFKKIGSVREYPSHEDELRMEVYLDFIEQLPRTPEVDSPPLKVICIAAGRKAMIAAVVSAALIFGFSVRRSSGQLPTVRESY
jgi:hypothetical protein